MKKSLKDKAVNMARETVCFECPDAVHKKCSVLNNGGLSCAKLFAEYLEGKYDKG